MTEDLTIVATVTAKPGREAEVAAAIRACLAPSRGDPGCLFYTAHRDEGTPGRFVFAERWASQSALEAHMRTAHFLALAKALDGLAAEPLAALPLVPLD